MKRSDVEKAINRFYVARLTNDPNKYIQRFGEGGIIHLAGATDASAIAGKSTSSKSLKAMIKNLTSDWKWQNVEILQQLIDGANAAVMHTLTAIFTPRNEEFSTLVLDYFEFDESLKIKRLTEFGDTAMAEKLVFTTKPAS